MPATAEITPKSILRHRTIGADIHYPAPLATRTSRSKQSATIPCWTVVHPPKTVQKETHWVFTLGTGMLLALLILLLGQMLLGWLGTVMDDIRYGYPRTFQTDAFVGHEKTGLPSHFLAMNLRGHIEVIELPGGDAAHARIFVGPQLYGPGADLLPVKVQFVVTHNSHTPDMDLTFQNTTLIFHNIQGTFVAGP